MEAIPSKNAIIFLLCSLLASNGILANESNGMYCEDGICTRISQEPVLSICKDQDERCKHWASQGECEHNPIFIHQQCPLSCRICPKFACVDEDKSCSYWASIGECKANPYYMQNSCSQSCNMCTEELATPDNSSSECKDTLEECSIYVSQGMCTSSESQIFMMNNCPLACGKCDSLEEFDRCIGKRHPFKKPVFAKKYSGSDSTAVIKESTPLDDFFDKIAADETSIVITQPSSLNGGEKLQDPFIFQINGALSDHQCEELIHNANSIGWDDSTVNQSDHFDNMHPSQLPVRSSKSVKCNDSHRECQETISDIISTLGEKTGIATHYFEAGEIVHYGESDYYTAHHNHRLSDEYKPTGPRLLTMYINLSGVTAGGYIGFPELDWLLVSPGAKGSLLLWPNVDQDLKIDSRMKNELMPIREGSLYLLEMHVHLYNYLDSIEMDCA